MEFRVLGPLEVYENGEPVPLGGTRQRALLAVLLLHAGHVVSSDRLVDELWGEEPPATAAHTIQVYVSNLRKALARAIGEEAARARLETRPPGYRLRVDPGELDLTRFEEIVERARERLAAGDAKGAADRLREAAGLWRGPALADFAFEPFAQSWIARLDELRLAAVEDRVDADLAAGRHAELVGELEALVQEHPLRERLRGQLMLALYRSGRQAEALDVYQETRRALVDELGIDPSPALQRLEKGILVQDSALDLQQATPTPVRAPAPALGRSILLVSDDHRGLAPLVRVAEPLARSRAPHELIASVLVPAGSAAELKTAAGAVNELRAELTARGVAVRATAFTSSDSTEDTIRLSLEHRVDLLLLGCPEETLADGTLGAPLTRVLADAPCDVALVIAREPPAGPESGVSVPFGGSEHDWSALELGAWIASATGTPLRLIGTESDPETGRRDASRLLASAALAAQQLVAVATEPVLVEHGSDAIDREAAAASVVVVGLSERWRAEGLGPARLAVAREAAAPLILVRSGVRPGGLAPADGLTRFTWSLRG